VLAFPWLGLLQKYPSLAIIAVAQPESYMHETDCIIHRESKYI